MTDDLESFLDKALPERHTGMNRDRAYIGQPHTTDGERGRLEVSGVTMRDIRDCYNRALVLSAGDSIPDVVRAEAEKGEHSMLSEADIGEFVDLSRLDPVAVSQNLCNEIERIMGVYPYLPRSHRND